MFGLSRYDELSIRIIQRRRKSICLFLGLFVVVTVVTLYAFVDSLIGQSSRISSVISPLQRQDVQNCLMSYSYPTYTEIEPPDHALSKKYKLYLYREGNLDAVDTLYGVPALFIPGQAGSYKQIRSLASATTNCYHKGLCSGHNIDYFTVDLNEELSALDGGVLLDQAEYMNAAIKRILSLYNTAQKPTSVIIIAHSMGGLVARTMFMLPNYIPNSIQTVITLATPHLAAPVLLERTMYQLYQDLTFFWKKNHEKLSNVVIISIAGGSLDTIVHSDGVSINEIVPTTQGFTAYTTSIPNVWTGIDHMAILWCNQLIRLLASTVVKIADLGQMPTTEARMEIFRQSLLLDNDYSSSNADVPIFRIFDYEKRHIRSPSETSLKVLFDNDQPSLTLIPFDVRQLKILTNIDKKYDSCWFLAHCSSELECAPFIPNVTLLPSIMAANLEKAIPNRVMTIRNNGLSKYLGIAKRCYAKSSEGPAFIQSYATSERPIVHNATLWSVMSTGLSFNASSYQNIHKFPNIQSSVFAYNVRIQSITDNRTEKAFCKPMMLQTIDGVEPKFYRRLEQGVSDRITFHRDTSRNHTGLSLEFFTDNQELGIRITIDWYGTLGRVIHRYGAMLANFCWVNTLIILVTQLLFYASNGKREFPSYIITVIHCIKDPILPFAVLLSISNICQYCILRVEKLKGTSITRFLSDHIVMDSSEWQFAVLVVFLYILSLGLIITAWVIISAILLLMSKFMPLSVTTSTKRHQSTRKYFCIYSTILIGLASFIPTSLIFLVYLIIWSISTSRAKIRAQFDFPTVQNVYNYRLSWLMFLTANAPYYLPQAVVYLKNLLIGWTQNRFDILLFVQDFPLVMITLWLLTIGKNPDILDIRYLRPSINAIELLILYQLLNGFLHPFPLAHILTSYHK